MCKTPTYRKSEVEPARPAGAWCARLVRFASWLAGSAVLVFVAGLACEPHALRVEPVLLFSANNDGILAACGCPGNPSGGFAKRQGLIEQYRRTCRNVLLVDPGDLFPDHKNETLVKYLARAAARATRNSSSARSACGRSGRSMTCRWSARTCGTRRASSSSRRTSSAR